MEFSTEEKPSLKYLLKESCKRFNQKEKARQCKIYNKKGIELLAEDVQFIKADDVLYIALDGKCSSAGPAVEANFHTLIHPFCGSNVQVKCLTTAQSSTIM